MALECSLPLVVFSNHLGSNHQLSLNESPGTDTSHILAVKEVENHQVDFRITIRTLKCCIMMISVLGSPGPMQVHYLGEKLGDQEVRVCCNCQFLRETMSWQTKGVTCFHLFVYDKGLS